MEARCLQQPSTSSIPAMAVGEDDACCSSDMRSRLCSTHPRRSGESTGKSSPAVLGAHHIYFGSNSDVSAEEHRVSLSMSTGLKLGRFDRVYLDTCDIPGMESSRINNSTDSPASSSTALAPVVPDWRLHRRLDVHSNDQPGLKSGEGSHPLNNYDDSDAVLENGRDTGSNLGRWDLSRWDENDSRHDKKTLKFKDPMVQGSKRIGIVFTDTDGGGEGRTGEKIAGGRVYEELQHAKVTLVETLEAVIALLSMDVDENCECSTAPSRGVQPALASDTSSPEIGYTSTISSPHSEEHMAVRLEGTFRQSQSPEWEFPIPCEMRSTYNEPAICPMEITEESRPSDKSPIPQSDQDSLRPLGRAAEARQRRSRENNSHSRVTSSHFHRGKSSQKSLAREPSSASVSDWDVREAEIEVKQPQTFSESDEAFEEFVRNQERQFPPPSPPEIWDPLQAPASWRQYNQSNAPRQWTAPVLLEDDSYSGDFPATHEMGVQVNSIELESAPKKPFLGRLLRTSSELGERWRAVVKSRGMKSWIWKKKTNGPGAPAPVSTLRDRSRDNYSRSSEENSPAQSETAATMVSVVSQDCGWPTSQLRKLIPRRFTDDHSRTSVSRPSTGDTGRLTTYGDFFYVESGTSLGGQTFTELSQDPGGRGRWKRRQTKSKSSVSVRKSVSKARHRRDLLVEMVDAHTSLDSREIAPEFQQERAWDEGCSGMNPAQFKEGGKSCGEETRGKRWRGGSGKEKARKKKLEKREDSTHGGEKRECTASLTRSEEEEEEEGGLDISSGSGFASSTGKTGSSKTQSNKACGQNYRRRSSSFMRRFCSCVTWQNGLFGVSGSMSGTTFSISEQ
ncbi:hypothetical protein BSKO_00738 [Bryopsis sp. KO-2023]|nr:hypothetical protein BSKO_00738 [Bryopsis sp. KO-2023]